MVRNIALTGATGFVGRAVLLALLNAGHDVKVLVRRPKVGQFPEKVQVVEGDLANGRALAEFVKGADCVVHVAGAISAFSREQFFQANSEGVQSIFSASKLAGVKHFIHISSLAARRPEISAYAESKRGGEEFLQSRKGDMSIAILRPSAIYGPSDKATLPLISALQKKIALIPSTAKARFSLLHVRDFANVVVAAVASEATGLFEVDDLSGGHTWAELAAVNKRDSGLPKRVIYLPYWLVAAIAMFAEVFSFITRKSGMITRDKVRELYQENWVVEGSNWVRPHPIELSKGLVETLEWYRSNGWLAAKTQEKL